jgi:hypothetical protein
MAYDANSPLLSQVSLICGTFVKPPGPPYFPQMLDFTGEILRGYVSLLAYLVLYNITI